MTALSVGVVFHPRILGHLTAAKVQPKQLTNILKSPHVLRAFHLITPYALQVLDRDTDLLAVLGEHFANSRVLSAELGRALAAKPLIFTPFVDPTAPMFYGLRGTNQAEGLLLASMAEDFANNPNLQDIGVCLEALCGISIASSSELGPKQLATLHFVFNPFDPEGVAQLLKGKDIRRIFVADKNKIGCTIARDQETSQLTFSFSSSLLNENATSLRTAFLGILRGKR